MTINATQLRSHTHWSIVRWQFSRKPTRSYKYSFEERWNKLFDDSLIHLLTYPQLPRWNATYPKNGLASFRDPSLIPEVFTYQTMTCHVRLHVKLTHSWDRQTVYATEAPIVNYWMFIFLHQRYLSQRLSVRETKCQSNHSYSDNLNL